MTREEAIKHFEAQAQCNYKPTREAAELAVAALRAQQKLLEMLERDRDAWELCSSCRPGRFFGNRFCHECGLPLNEWAWEELERRIGGNKDV